jgi:hypothetical protein
MTPNLFFGFVTAAALALSACNSEGPDTSPPSHGKSTSEADLERVKPEIQNGTSMPGVSASYRARKPVEPSNPSDGLVELVATPSLSLDEIKLGDQAVEEKAKFKPSPVTEAVELIEKTFSITDSNSLISIIATPDNHIGFRLAVAKDGEIQDDSEFLYSSRHYGRSKNSLKIQNISLPVGKYTALVRRDRLVDIDLQVEILKSPKIEVVDVGVKRKPTAINLDVLGKPNRSGYFLKPNGLESNKVYNAFIAFPAGSGSISVLDKNGQVTNSRSGKSPLTITGLRGAEWALKVIHNLQKNEPENTKWRLKINEVNDTLSFDESVSVESIMPYLKRADVGLSGWLDSHDLDSFRLYGNGSSEEAPYYIHYKGPQAKLVTTSGRNSGSIVGHKATLGPFSPSVAIDLSIQSIREAYGDYTLKYESNSSSKAMALEPDSTALSNRYLATEKVYGSISDPNDRDYISFDLGDTAQMWRPIVIGETIGQISVSSPYENLYTARRDARRNSKKRFPIPDLYMGPGPVTLQLSGVTGEYRVFMKPLGPPLKNSEREPNQTPFFRRATFGQQYNGTLELADTDNYSFFLEKPARIKVDVSVPAGGVFQLNHQLNGFSNERSPLYRKPLKGNATYQADLMPGENILTLNSRVASPAEYGFKVSLVPPFDGQLRPLLKEGDDPLLVKGFSLLGQRISLTEFAGLPVGGASKIWTPTTKIKFDRQSNSLEISADLPNGRYPIWLSNSDETDMVGLSVIAQADGPTLNPFEDNPLPEKMRGGINVALSSLGAKWVSQPGYELDELEQLPRKNSAGAFNLKALNDGVSALSSDTGYYHIFSKRSDTVYQPVIQLAGSKPVPIVGVVLTDRIQVSNNASRFAVDVSIDNATWSEVISDRLLSWDKRNIFQFPEGVVEASFVRLRMLSEGQNNDLIALSEFEVIAQPGSAGLENIMISATSLGASGRLVDSKGYARSIDVGLLHTDKKPLIEPITQSGYTKSGITLSFNKQAIAEIDDVEFHFGSQRAGDNSQGPVLPPRYAKISGSVSGPYGPFDQTVEVELPKGFGSGSVASISLPERVRANAVRIEYKAEDESSKWLQIPAYYRLFERKESENYHSVLGLGAEFQARILGSFAKNEEKSVKFSEEANTISLDRRLHKGLVELNKRSNRWLVERRGEDNTLILSVQGEKGFFPNVDVATLSGKRVQPLESVESAVRGETTWQFDLPETGLVVTVSEPPRSTVFLMDQSPSAQAYIARARRSVIDYADMMVQGEDKIHFAALGGEFMSEDWVSDPVVLSRKLVEYPTDGNSDGEGSIVKAAKVLNGVSGTRSIVIFTDGDVGPAQGIFKALSNSSARVFPIKISSAKIWGNPVAATTTSLQWSGVSGGEMSYVFRDQDITDSYARIASRLLGPKSYSLRASSRKRLISPGSLTVQIDESKLARDLDNSQITHHILFDASGSMLKRTGNTRRVEIARKALVDFVQDTLSAQHRIGLRVFGGAPDTCETNLLVNPSTGTKDDFLEKVVAIRPQNKAKTPIAEAISRLSSDLESTQGSARILLITDGEETCDGDAGAIIQELIDTELADRVDIVSFALDAGVDRSVFIDWAKRGRGLYIDAQDGASLAEALRQTTEVRYDVLNNGKLVLASQALDHPVALPKGNYTVKIMGKLISIKITSEENTMVLVEP